MSSKKKNFLEKTFPKLHQQFEESKELERQKYYFNARAVSLTKEEYDAFMSDENIKLKVDYTKPICFDIWGNSYSEWTIRNAFSLFKKENRQPGQYSFCELYDKQRFPTNLKLLETNIVVYDYKGLLFLFDPKIKVVRVLSELGIWEKSIKYSPINQKVTEQSDIGEFIEKNGTRILNELREKEERKDDLPF